MKATLTTLLILLCLAGYGQTSAKKYYYKSKWPTCMGKTPCKACKSCKSCKRCKGPMGTCGVCKKVPVDYFNDRDTALYSKPILKPITKPKT